MYRPAFSPARACIGSTTRGAPSSSPDRVALVDEGACCIPAAGRQPPGHSRGDAIRGWLLLPSSPTRPQRGPSHRSDDNPLPVDSTSWKQKKMEQEKLQKLARKGPSTREHAPTSPSSAVSDVKAAGGAGPASSASTSESTNKNRNYAVLAGTIVGLSAMG